MAVIEGAWTHTHRSHPAVDSSAILASTLSAPTLLDNTVTDAAARASLASPPGVTFTCSLCLRHGTRDSALYAVPCDCPLDTQRSLHRSCAANMSEKHKDQELRCRTCKVGFHTALSKSSVRYFWRDVLCGTIAGFAQVFVVLIILVGFLHLADVSRSEIVHDFLQHVHLWVVPLVAFPIWMFQRAVMVSVIPWRVSWLRVAKPWSCIALRTVLPMSFCTSRDSFFVLESSTKGTVSWRRLVMALCCDLCITCATLWVNYRFAPIYDAPYSPITVLLISFLLAIVYAKVFRKKVKAIQLGELRPGTLNVDLSLTGQIRDILAEV